MKHLRLLAFLAIGLLGGVEAARAQTAMTKAALETQNNTYIAPNGVGAISATVLNAMLGNMIYSGATLLDANTLTQPQKFSGLPSTGTIVNSICSDSSGNLILKVMGDCFPSAGTGTVTSVAMSVPTGLAISGTPITSSGTLALTWSGGIPNSALANATMTINGTVCTLGASCTPSGGGGSAPGGATNAVQYNAGSSTLGGVSLAANQLLQGTGGTPSALSIGTGVATALGNASNGSGGFVTSPVANANLANDSVTVNTVSCVLGGSCTISASASLVVGSTTITSGTNGDVEVNNSGVLGEKAATTTATASALAQRDSSANLSANNFLSGYTTTATAAGTTTLTVASTQQQIFTGSTTQTVLLPATSTLALGVTYFVYNNSTGAVTVESSGSNSILVIGPGGSASFAVILTTGTTAASWSASYLGVVVASGKVATFSNTLTFAGTDGTTETFPSTSATVAALNIQDQSLTGGATVTPNAQATGSFTLDCGKSPLQWIADTGAFTITAPTRDGACTLQIEMGASAASPTLSGFTVGSNTGDAFTTTSGNKFKMYVTRIHSISSYTVQALQ